MRSGTAKIEPPPPTSPSEKPTNEPEVRPSAPWVSDSIDGNSYALSRGSPGRAVDAAVPGGPHQNASHAAKAGEAGRDQPGADEGRHGEEPRRHEEAEQRADESKTAGSNLRLALKFQRLVPVAHDRQARLAPGVEPAFDDIRLAGLAELRREPRRVGLGAHAALAMKDDGLALMHGKVCLVELRQRQVPCAGDLLAGMLVGFADVNEEGAAVEKTARFGWLDCG